MDFNFSDIHLFLKYEGNRLSESMWSSNGTIWASSRENLSSGFPSR